MTRPSRFALCALFVISVGFTALVATDVLGVVWLSGGPGAVAAIELVVSTFYDRGMGTAVPLEPAPDPVPSGIRRLLCDDLTR